MSNAFGNLQSVFRRFFKWVGSGSYLQSVNDLLMTSTKKVYFGSTSLSLTDDGTNIIIDSGGAFLPAVTNTEDIGSSSVKFKAGYFTGTVVCGDFTPTGDITLATTKKLILGNATRYVTDDGTGITIVCTTASGYVRLNGTVGIGLQYAGTDYLSIGSNGANIKEGKEIRVYRSSNTNYSTITKGATDNLTIQDVTGTVNVDGKTGVTLKYNTDTIASITATALNVVAGNSLVIYRTGSSNYSTISKGATDNLTIQDTTGSISIDGKTSVTFKLDTVSKFSVTTTINAFANVYMQYGTQTWYYKNDNSNYATITKGSTDNLTITEGTGQLIVDGKTHFNMKVNGNTVADVDTTDLISKSTYGFKKEGPNGSTLKLQTITEEITVTVGNSSANGTGNLLPSGSIIAGVVGRVTQAPGTAVTFDVRAVGSGDDEYAQGISTALNTTFTIGAGDGTVTGPQWNFGTNNLQVETNAVVSATDFKVRLITYYWQATPPTS